MINPVAQGEVIRFLAVGGFSTLLNYGVFLLLLKAGVNYALASGVGFIAGGGVGYDLNKRWTFGISAPSTMSLALSYLAVYLVSLCWGLVTIWLLVEGMKINALVANVMSITLTTCTNFLGTRFLVFRR